MGARFKPKQIVLSISPATYEQLESLARQKGMVISNYLQRLLAQHLLDLGLPVYYDMDMGNAEAEDAGQAQ